MFKKNAEGETPKQEKVEGHEPLAKEKSEMKAPQSKPSASRGMFDVKPGESLPHEQHFKTKH